MTRDEAVNKAQAALEAAYGMVTVSRTATEATIVLLEALGLLKLEEPEPRSPAQALVHAISRATDNGNSLNASRVLKTRADDDSRNRPFRRRSP